MTRCAHKAISNLLDRTLGCINQKNFEPMDQISYTLESEHFHDFRTAAMRELVQVNGLKGQLVWGVVVGSIVAFAAVAIGKFLDSCLAMGSFFAGAWFFWIVHCITSMHVGRRSASLEFSENGLVLGARQLSIDDEGIHVTGNSFGQDIDWKIFKSMSVQHLVIVLWTDKTAGVFIPRSAFASAKDENDFVSMVQSRIGTA